MPKVSLFFSSALFLVYLLFLQLQIRLPVISLSLLPSYPVVSRSGDGEHRRYLRGAGVWPAGGYLHGGFGVCVDVKADTRK